MLKEKKKQIVKAEKDALNTEMKKAFPEEAKVEPKVSPVGVDKKKKIAEAVKAVIKSTQEEQAKLDALKAASKKK